MATPAAWSRLMRRGERRDVRQTKENSKSIPHERTSLFLIGHHVHFWEEWVIEEKDGRSDECGKPRDRG